jgi:hypothetical protein
MPREVCCSSATASSDNSMSELVGTYRMLTHDLRGRTAADPLAVVDDLALARRHHAQDGPERGGLAAALPPSRQTSSPG